MEENILLKELLASHRGENPVVINFKAPDEFNNPSDFELLVDNHLWVDLDGSIERDINANFKQKVEVEVTPIG